ncbi:MAG: hypothetical protein ACREQ5_00525 [Candidatus Dormibacteria bacterium]
MPRKSSRLTLESTQRRERIIKMRRARLTWDAIGKREGISGQMVGRIYQEALAEIPIHQIDEHRAEEMDLIDLATNRLMALAADTTVTPRTRIEAWNSICRWAEHKAKLLGLLAPQKVQVMSMDALDAEIAELKAIKRAEETLASD